MTISENSRIDLECSANAKPIATIIWYKEGTTGTVGKEANKTNTLSFDKATREYAGKYRCEASNAAGSVSYSVQVIVQCKYFKKDDLQWI